MPDEQNSTFFTSLDELKDSLEHGHKDSDDLLDLTNLEKQDSAEDWFSEDYEGQLSVDVYQNKENIIIKSTIAGVRPEDLEIYIHNDLLTIRGRREQEISKEDTEYFYKECYWGGFSRSIILPVEVQADKIEATLKNGVLTITLPKSQKSKLINVKIKEE